MNEEKKKFKMAAIAAWQGSFKLKEFLEMVGHPSPEGEREWRAQYAMAQMPFGDNEEGFAEFVRTMPG